MVRNKMKKKYLIAIIIILILGASLLLLRGLSGEDSWIKDSNGIWIKHGNPSQTPDYVLEQQKTLLNCTSNKLDNYGNCLETP